ncbi:MAG: AEC family transporter [Slackia sp.]|nr:AEC family transporter [Slackia sp.]
MDDLVFSLNATMPVFLLMVFGMILRRLRVIDDVFASCMNAFVFHVALPVLLFGDISSIDFGTGWDGRFVAACFAITLASIAIVWMLSFAIRKKGLRGEFIQSAYRSSAALLGVALMQNMYGSSEMAALMIVGAVPLYNIVAVVALTAMKPEGKQDDARTLVKRSLRGIVANPIIAGIAAGFVFALSGLPMPPIAQSLIGSIGGLATPLGLIAMGAMFDLRRAAGQIGPAAAASLIKLVGLAALFLPVAVACGFRGEELATIAVMLGSPTTVSCFVMARSFGHEGVLSSTATMLTTLGSAFTLTGILFILRTLAIV